MGETIQTAKAVAIYIYIYLVLVKSIKQFIKKTPNFPQRNEFQTKSINSSKENPFKRKIKLPSENLGGLP